MEFGRKQFASGVVCLFADASNSVDLEELLEAELAKNLHSFALVYFSKEHWKSDYVLATMSRYAPTLEYAACSTAGELTPHGMTVGKMVIILFAKDQFEINAFQISQRDSLNMESLVTKVAGWRSKFFKPDDSETDISPFVICLMDGMSYMEESITAALHWGLNDIPLLGGSAGDNLNFNETYLTINGRIEKSYAIILMVKSKLPIQLFKTDNFIPTKIKLIVTESEPDKRVVHEFNGLPAAKVYAETIGVDPERLDPQSFASHPLVVRVGGEYYCRSIQKVNDDGSLTFFCAIDDGVVLTVAEPTGMARSTEETIDDVRNSLGEIDFIIGFDCVLRQLDARNRQVTQKISQIYRDNHIIGFNTYGEQYRSMHLNQTFTGIAFGMPMEPEEKYAT